MTSTESTPLSPQHQATASDAGAAPASSRATGLYLHIPFCFHKCHYCDFYSIVDQAGDDDHSQQDRQAALVDALVCELRECARQYALRPITIFAGGGTPTLLRGELWQRLLDEMRALRLLDEVTEFTVEANPETLTDELLQVLVAGGVNRLSIGAQSFQPHLLETLQRWHEPASVARAVELARKAGITDFNLDLIFAIPGQTMRDLASDLDAVLALEPTHLSCYSLIFEPGTPLAMKRKLGQIEPMDEETERAMYEHVMQRMHDAGFEHYEISNWAKVRGQKSEVRGQKAETDSNKSPMKRRGFAALPDPHTANAPSHHCKHNLMYWRNENWLGIGPSAASHVDGRRWKNVPHLGRYIAGVPHPPVQDEEQLDDEARLGEQLMLALRLREGVRRDWLDTALANDPARRQIIDELIAQQCLERTSTHLRLTHEGLFVADTVMSRLL